MIREDYSFPQKQYMLLKDTPKFKSGKIFFKIRGLNSPEYAATKDRENEPSHVVFSIKEVENNTEWFERVELAGFVITDWISAGQEFNEGFKNIFYTTKYIDSVTRNWLHIQMQHILDNPILDIGNPPAVYTKNTFLNFAWFIQRKYLINPDKKSLDVIELFEEFIKDIK